MPEELVTASDEVKRLDFTGLIEADIAFSEGSVEHDG